MHPIQFHTADYHVAEPKELHFVATKQLAPTHRARPFLPSKTTGIHQ